MVMHGSAERIVTPLAGTLGARIAGVDVVKDLDDATVAWLSEQLYQHHVLVFPEQTMTPADEVAFARRFGPISIHPYVPPLAGHPEVLEVVDPRNRIARNWHQDQTYLERPPFLTMLVERVLPPSGGDTMFANQYLAFEELSPGLKATLVGMRGCTVAPNVPQMPACRAPTSSSLTLLRRGIRSPAAEHCS